MPENKIKLRDLADEIGRQPKELFQGARELNLPIKSLAGSLTESEANRLREHITSPKETLLRTKTETGVIVRRRKKIEDNRQPRQDRNDSRSDARFESGQDSRPVSKDRENRYSLREELIDKSQNLSSPDSKNQSDSRPDREHKTDLRLKDNNQTASRQSESAKIEREANSSTTAIAEANSNQTSQIDDQSSTQVSAKEAGVSQQGRQTNDRSERRKHDNQQDSQRESQRESQKETKHRESKDTERASVKSGEGRRQQKSRHKKEAPTAKIVAMPAKIIQRPQDQIAQAESVQEVAKAEVTQDKEVKNISKKERPAISPLLVILKAEEEASRAERQAERNREKAARAKARAAAQAENKERENQRQERRSEKAEAERQEQPKVRIISRPSPQAISPEVRSDSRPDARSEARSDARPQARQTREVRDFRDRDKDSGRDSRESRDQRGRDRTRDGHNFRDRASDGRDRDDRDSRDRDSRDRGDRSFGQRSDRSPGQRSSRASVMDFMPAVDAIDGQSRKKRNKGSRRTVDFQQSEMGHRHEEDDAPRMNRNRKRKPAKTAQPQGTQPLKAAKRKIRVAEAIRVADMAHQMGLKANEIIKVLFNLGVMSTINQSLDIETATLVAAEFDYEIEKVGFSEDEYLISQEADNPEDLLPRPPVVTIMGHVDHGKTSLLDAIRKTNVTSSEAGGITQHIGAYHVKTRRGDIVFLDTPGHEAFTAMRARGARVTDLVILVVAADDGVMEQTREAINHSKAANVPIIVAVNKMDKPGADPDRVLRELSELGLQAEDWGGDTIVAKVSAKTREGLDDLLEMVALQSEIMELKSNPNKPAHGRIIEARLDKGRGSVATVLIQEGTLKQGDNFVCGQFSGRARALMNDQGKKIREAGPAIPVEVQGFDGVPEAGEEFFAVADEKVARRIADARAAKQREKVLANESRVTLETFLSRRVDAQETLTLNLVLKADVQGSLEAIAEALNKQSTNKVRINIVHDGTGAITESDILLASASQAIIIGFNIRPAAKIKEVAERENVDIRFYDIIYQLVDDVKSAMAGMLAPVQKEIYLGQAEVRKVYNLSKVGMVAGSYVADGKLSRNAGVRLLRDGVVVHTGKISSLKHFKDDAREVVKGNECGLCLENFNDIKVGDIIEAFETVEEAASL